MTDTRQRTLTQKVESKHGSHYVHVSFDDAGHPCGMRISSPGKFRDSDLGQLLESISDVATELMQ